MFSTTSISRAISFKTHSHQEQGGGGTCALGAAVGGMEEIKITLETLYDILRNEKKREDLQKLEATFYLDLVHYLREKNALLQAKTKDTNIFAVGERDKLEYELRSIKRILKELYEKREKKIIDIALNKSRTGSEIIDTSAMLPEEKELYLKILASLDLYRQGILMNLWRAQLPDFKTIITAPEGSGASDTPLLTAFTPPPAAPQPEENSPATTRIKFIRPLPKFIWKDMKTYGPFDPGEETEIFAEVAELIVRKGRAVKV